MTRAAWLPHLRAVFAGRSTRWAENPSGAYNGPDQLQLLHQFRVVRSDVEATAGGPVIVLFHTTKETARLYAAVVARDLERQ